MNPLPENGSSDLPATLASPPPDRALDSTLRGQAGTSAPVAEAEQLTDLDEQTRALLRDRVRASGWACLVGFSLLFVTGRLLGQSRTVEIVDGAGPPNVALTALSLAVLIAARRAAELRLLRVLELALFGGACVIAGVWRYTVSGTLPPVSPDPNHPQLAVWYANATSNLLFYFLIFFYGMMIPNERRRCAAVVGGMAAVPIVATVAALLTNSDLRPHGGLVIAVTTVGVAAAAFGAVVGAARITRLRRQVYIARREARQVGAYTLRRLLGKGGMGEVWLAEHRLLKRPCAVKFVRTDVAQYEDIAARFEREVRAVTGLTHLHTVRVYDYGRAEDGSFYYVMEYLEGPTLDNLVRESGPLDPARVVYLLRQLCGALAEAHAVGLVHRDLKPGNILVAHLGGQRDVAKLLDFGLVQDLSVSVNERLTQTGVVIGTPAYMSPEQASGHSTSDARGDVYSLGAVAYFALTGRAPFEGRPFAQLLAAHRTETPQPLTDVPGDLAAVVARCLEKAPADRYSSAQALERDLARCACATDWSAELASVWWANRTAPVAQVAADVGQLPEIV